MRLEGKVALVTGAARERGIGRGIALAPRRGGLRRRRQRRRSRGRGRGARRADPAGGPAAAHCSTRPTCPTGPQWTRWSRRSCASSAASTSSARTPASPTGRTLVDVTAGELPPAGGRQPDRRVQRLPGGARAPSSRRETVAASSSPPPCTCRWRSRRCRSTAGRSRRSARSSSTWRSSSPRTGSRPTTSAPAGCARTSTTPRPPLQTEEDVATTLHADPGRASGRAGGARHAPSATSPRTTRRT